MKAVPISVLPAFVLGFVIFAIFPDADEPDFGGDFWAELIGIVVFSPAIETLLMWPVLALLSRFMNNTWALALASAGLWALLHSLMVPVWGFNIFWSFVVFSICFVEWRKKSIGAALSMTFLIHALQNLCAFALMQLE